MNERTELERLRKENETLLRRENERLRKENETILKFKNTDFKLESSYQSETPYVEKDNKIYLQTVIGLIIIFIIGVFFVLTA